MKFYKLKNGNIVTDYELAKAYEITTGTHLELGNSLHTYYLNRYIGYLYTVSLERELEPSDENVKLIALVNRTQAAIMYKSIHKCSAQEALDYIKSILGEV